MKNEKILSRIMEPVMARIKAGAVLAGLSALCYTLAVCAFALAINDLARGEVNLSLLIAGAALSLCEYFGRMFAFSISHKAAFSLEEILRIKLSKHLARIPYGQIQLNLCAQMIEFGLQNLSNLSTTPS